MIFGEKIIGYKISVLISATKFFRNISHSEYNLESYDRKCT
jgi:hypothetical protein